MLPVDKIIGRFYPIFCALLVISAIGIGIGLLITGEAKNIPEITLENLHPDGLVVFPLLFLTISCGALSDFHATQSPIISRTTQHELHGRKIFYGMMIAEGIIAMIWAAAAMAMFYEPNAPFGAGLAAVINEGTPSLVVSKVAVTMLGGVGGTLAILGVIILPITSGDKAFRSARMIIADYLKVPQIAISKRLMIAIPIFLISVVLLQIDFNILWRYFSRANQSTAVIALFVGAMYLYIGGKNYWVSLIPGSFMLMATITYILQEKIGFGLPRNIALILSLILSIIIIMIFFWQAKRQKAMDMPLEDDISKWAGKSGNNVGCEEKVYLLQSK